MRIHGVYLGEPTTLVVEDGRVTWDATVAPGTPWTKDRSIPLEDLTVIAFERVRYGGIRPGLVIAAMFTGFAALSGMVWVTAAFGAITALGFTGALLSTPRMLVLATATERFEIYVQGTSLDAVEAFVAEHGRPGASLPTARVEH